MLLHFVYILKVSPVVSLLPLVVTSLVCYFTTYLVAYLLRNISVLFIIDGEYKPKVVTIPCNHTCCCRFE